MVTAGTEINLKRNIELIKQKFNNYGMYLIKTNKSDGNWEEDTNSKHPNSIHKIKSDENIQVLKKCTYNYIR